MDFLFSIKGEASHSNTKSPLILKTPPGVDYFGGVGDGLVGGRDYIIPIFKPK